MLLLHDETLYAKRDLQARARDYIMKRASMIEMRTPLHGLAADKDKPLQASCRGGWINLLGYAGPCTFIDLS